MAMNTLDPSTLHAWLAPLSALPLECDGLTRVISTLLAREDIDHRVMIGTLSIEGTGRTPMHWWIELAQGELIDFRARMWLGSEDSIPHGVFNKPEHAFYSGQEGSGHLDPTVFFILANQWLDDVPRFQPATSTARPR